MKVGQKKRERAEQAPRALWVVMGPKRHGGDGSGGATEADGLRRAFFEAGKALMMGDDDGTRRRQEDLRRFVERVGGAGRRLAIVTAGGTTIPLEKRTVRYIDNFSTGNRGAAIAESLLRFGYSVLFRATQGCFHCQLPTLSVFRDHRGLKKNASNLGETLEGDDHLGPNEMSFCN